MCKYIQKITPFGVELWPANVLFRENVFVERMFMQPFCGYSSEKKWLKNQKNLFALQK